jgi:23S rRNA (uracil1939-C5)-methyltransferase
MEASQTMARPQRGDELTLTIDSLAYGGAGVARTESGYVVFVSGGMPGDTVRAVVGKRKRSYAEARALEIISPGPDRVDPVADHPGAPWQVLAYERQLEIKTEQVRDALTRIGGFENLTLEPIVPAEQQWRYRNKLEYSFGTGPEGELLCGFHAPGNWEEIVPLTDCLLASEAGNAVRERIVRWCREQGLTAYDRRTNVGFLRNLVVREGRRTGSLQARLVTSDDADGLDREALVAAASADLKGLLWTRIESVGETTQGGVTEVLAGSTRFREEIGGMTFRISAEAFFQTNTEMADRLYALATEYARPCGFERLYDLYCGIGTIGLLMSPRVAELWGLELVEDAIEDAISNARSNEIDNAHFFAGDVRLALRELVEKAGRPDLLVVDPPRSGLSQKVVRRIIEASPARIVYVSCNPTTLAPNAAQLVRDGGYELVRVRPVDMFPQTPHIECVAELVRRSQPSSPAPAAAE